MMRRHEASLKIWFRDEIANVLRSVDRANRDIADAIPTREMALYRRGFTAALRAVAEAFGISPDIIVSEHDKLEAR